MKRAASSRWTFLTNHAMVLIQISHSPDATIRDIAEHVGITERATHRILSALVKEGYVQRRRVGRNNHYAVDQERTFRHPRTAHLGIRRLLDLLRP